MGLRAEGSSVLEPTYLLPRALAESAPHVGCEEVVKIFLAKKAGVNAQRGRLWQGYKVSLPPLISLSSYDVEFINLLGPMMNVTIVHKMVNAVM